MKLVLRTFIALAVMAIAAFWFLYFSPRPPLTINPATLAGDGSTINYCELPVLDGGGKTAADIPKGNTPGCGYTHFPLPILAACREPLIEGAADIRGLWMGNEGDHMGHVDPTVPRIPTPTIQRERFYSPLATRNTARERPPV